MSAPIPNQYEERARYLKATALADILQAFGITSDGAAGLLPESWIMIGRAINLKSDPGEETQALTIKLLRDREQAAERAKQITDPFARFSDQPREKRI